MLQARRLLFPQKVWIVSVVILVLLFTFGALLGSCVEVKTPPTEQQPDGGTAVVPGFSIGAAGDAGVSGMLDFLPGPVRAGLKLLAGLMTVSAAASAASKNGRAAYSVVGDPQNGVIESIQAAGHLATFGFIPPPASVVAATKAA